MIIQKLVKLFAAEMNCIISGCLQQWDVQDIAKPQEIGTCYAITNNYGKHLYLLYKNENIQSSDCTYFLWSCYNRVKYSIAWQEQCGPVIYGQYQLGDNGRGSTFVCERSKNSVCCWPLGYEYNKAFVICSSNYIEN